MASSSTRFDMQVGLRDRDHGPSLPLPGIRRSPQAFVACSAIDANRSQPCPSRKPIAAPYRVETIGLEVMGHAPVRQPTNL